MYKNKVAIGSGFQTLLAELYKSNTNMLENAAIKMYCHYSRRLEAPQNMRHPKSQYAATRQDLFTTTVRVD